MTTPWGLPDFDAHEEIHFVTDEKCGLKAIIAVHSTHLGPAAGGARFWHYAKDDDALTDALRLSRGMSYKNAMAGLPLGGGKSVILADAERTQDARNAARIRQGRRSSRRALRDRRRRRHQRRRHDRGRALNQVCRRSSQFGGRRRRRSGSAYVARRVPGHQGGGQAGARQGQPRRAAHCAAGRGQRRHRRRAPCLRGRREAVASPTSTRPRRRSSPSATGGKVVSTDEILALEADVLSPCALGAILDEQSIAALKVPVVAGGANNQLATPRGRPAAACSAASFTRPIM